VIEHTLERVAVVEPDSLDVVESADTEARRVAGEYLAASTASDAGTSAR
jgi:hypothetical protein